MSNFDIQFVDGSFFAYQENCLFSLSYNVKLAEKVKNKNSNPQQLLDSDGQKGDFTQSSLVIKPWEDNPPRIC